MSQSTVGQMHLPAAPAAVANVADLPHQSRAPDLGRRSLRRADGHVSAALCPRDPRARPSPNRTRRGHRASDRGLDGPTASTCAREPISRLTRTRRGRVRSHRRQPVALSPFRKSAVCITVSTASPCSRCAASIAVTADRPPVRSTRLRCSELLPMSTIFRALVGYRARKLTPALEASKWSALSSFRLFGRHNSRVARLDHAITRPAPTFR